jgi:hypothetical protein
MFYASPATVAVAVASMAGTRATFLLTTHARRELPGTSLQIDRGAAKAAQ